MWIARAGSLVVLLFLLSAPVWSQALTPADIALMASVKITSRMGGGCSGTLVRPDVILTAAHCVSRFSDVSYDTSKGRASLLARDAALDLAVLRLVGSECCPLTRASVPRTGKQVISVGAPLGFYPFLFSGVVSWVGLDSWGEKAEFGNRPHQVVLIHALVLEGLSGAAWLDASDGTLVGLHVRSLVGASGEGLGVAGAVGSDTVRLWLASVGVVWP